MKDTIKLAEYDKYKHNIRYWMLFTGSWPIIKPSILYRALPILAVTSAAIFSIMLLRFAIANITNINLMVKGFSFGVSYISVGFKVFLFAFYRENSIQLYTILHNYHTESLSVENLRCIVLKKLTGFRRLTWILATLVYSGCLISFMMPIIALMVQIYHHVQPINYMLPMPALYPWKMHPGGLLYKITYIFETYNILCMATVTAGIDSFFGYHVFHIIGQTQVLKYQITNLKPSDDHHKVIRRWVKKFLVLSKCCDLLQTIYGPVILWQIITNSAVICTILFQISHASGISIGRYLLIIGYSGGKIMQTYIYAWAGTVLTAESEALTESVYFSNWRGEGRHSLRTSILIMLAQRPFEITAAGCIIVSTEMFVTTMNTAVSYFFLLKTLEDKTN